MKILSLALILSLASTNAMARWIKVGDNYMFATYVDYATIRKADNKVTVRELVDLKGEQKILGARLLSAKIRNEYDCKKELWRLADSTFYSRNMGKGRAVYSNNFGNRWHPVEAGTFTEVLWTIACGRAAD